MLLSSLLTGIALVEATPQTRGNDVQNSGLTVDLGYGVVTSTIDTTGLHTWKGIRYAAPPLGVLRWQAPRAPPTDRTPVVASTYGPACPQSSSRYTGAAFVAGNEDCLYLNVYSPLGNATLKNATASLPVLVWIHGGGYGQGASYQQDPGAFIHANDDALVVVTIQYRLGAFGFASSPEIKARGVLNAGLLDQRFALRWVQAHIAQFGGDPSHVTIAGESSGAGSVLLHAVAQTSGNETLFTNIIAASPWIPTQPYYNNAVTVRHFRDFAATAGCTGAAEAFDCLVAKDSLSLQYASHLVSTNAPTPEGNWAFIPVTDDDLLSGPPSVLLSKHTKLNGKRVLIGNNANEGVLVPPRGITTEAALTAWLQANFAALSPSNISALRAVYPSSSAPDNAASPRFETDGRGPATAVNVSQVAAGHQQRAYNMYAEASVVCPSYWLADAFSDAGREAWHYQYSVPFAVHGADVAAYWGPPGENLGPDLVRAFRKILGNFVMRDNPSLTAADAGASGIVSGSSPVMDWPMWNSQHPVLLNMNQTGGVPYTVTSAVGVPVTQFRQPGLRNDFQLADADAWEGGRGSRCELWRKLGPFIPQ